jgi:cytochrome c-type biogenesis protein CcmH/NrfG
MRFLFLLAALLAGCATPPSAPGPGPQPEQPPAPVVTAPPPHKENVAIAGLMDSARADTAAGNLASAAASLERALRIEPRNARLWHELGQLRLRQRDYAQAESLAARSNTLAGSDADLRAANQRLIDDARSRR